LDFYGIWNSGRRNGSDENPRRRMEGSEMGENGLMNRLATSEARVQRKHMDGVRHWLWGGVYQGMLLEKDLIEEAGAA
jgi:hypothetical protein